MRHLMPTPLLSQTHAAPRAPCCYEGEESSAEQPRPAGCCERSSIDGSLTSNTLEIIHSSISKMEDESDIDHSLCEDGLSNQLSVRKRRSARRAAYMTASVGGETTNTSPSDQAIKTSSVRGETTFKTTNTSPSDQAITTSSVGGETTFKTTNTSPSDQAITTSSVGGETTFKTTNTSPSDQAIQTSNFDFVEKQGCIQVKEEHVSSGEEDTFYGEGEEQEGSREQNLGIIEIVLGKASEHKQRVLKFNVCRSKETSEDLRKQVVEAHKNGKGYKRIAKELDIHLSTVRKIICKWKKFSTVATLPRSGRPAKIGAKARHTILKHMRDNTRVTAKDLKASLAIDNINVHESTIRRTMSKCCSWDFTMEEDTVHQE